MLAQALDAVRAFATNHGRLAMSTETLADEADAVLAAVWDALGPVPTLLWGVAASDARRERAELAALDLDVVLAVPPDAVLYAPLTVQQRRVATLEELGAPDILLDLERAQLVALAAAPSPPAEWDRVFVLRDQLSAWPGYTRRGALSIDVARAVLQSDEVDLFRLLDDAALALATGVRARELALRDRLAERSFEIDGRANAALRAAVQAHDRVTQNPVRDDQTELEYLAEHAWPGSVEEFAAWWVGRVRTIGTCA
jgi:hypothetical protein